MNNNAIGVQKLNDRVNQSVEVIVTGNLHPASGRMSQQVLSFSLKCLSSNAFSMDFMVHHQHGSLYIIHLMYGPEGNSLFCFPKGQKLV